MALVDLSEVSLKLGGQQILDRVSLEIPEGAVVGLIGPNGAGKSSLLKVMAGLIRPAAGIFFLKGQKLSSPEQYRKHCSFSIDNPVFYPHLSGPKNLALMAKLMRKPKSIDEVLETVGLSEVGQKVVGHYSMGMRQRLMIAQNLMKDAQLIVLDEPFRGLDPNGFREVADLLGRLKQAGKTVFVSSHLLNELEELATHFVLLHEGKVALCLTAENLKKEALVVELEFQQKPSAEAMDFLDGLNAKTIDQDKYQLRLSQEKTGELVENLVKLGATPTGISSKNRLQEKYLEITA